MSRQHGKFKRGSAPATTDYADGDTVARINQAVGHQWRPGHEQYTLFTWAGVVPGRIPQTVDNRGLRRHIQHLAVLAVGYTGLPADRNGPGREFASVIAPVEISNDWQLSTGAPMVRTFGSPEGVDRSCFNPGREDRWLEASAFLADQLLSLFRVTPDGRLEAHTPVVGVQAIRAPKLAVNIETGVTGDGIPKSPKFVAIEDLEDSTLLGQLTRESAAFDCDSFPQPGYNVTGWNMEHRPLVPVYGMTPWFVLRTNIRAAFAHLDGMGVSWFLW